MPDTSTMIDAASRPVRVLVVEDEDNVALALEYVIRKEGYDHLRIADGADAATFLRQFRPDVVLLDVMLPNVSGYEICEGLRSDPDLVQTRVIMMTARGSAAQRSRALEAGADDFLAKPFSLQDLRAKLKSLIPAR